MFVRNLLDHHLAVMVGVPLRFSDSKEIVFRGKAFHDDGCKVTYFNGAQANLPHMKKATLGPPFVVVFCDG
jgi:hypothetical protein